MIPVMRIACVIGLLAWNAQAQDTDGPFGGFKHDSSAPIEITADSLEVRQADQIAVFDGNVVAGQGTLRLTADRVEALLKPEDERDETGAIERIDATGNVFLSNGAETAQGATGTYNVRTGIVTMDGNVVLTQGGNAISGSALRIDLNTGVGRIVGRVKTIFTPSSQQEN
ncbi:MAG: lipopolysaccharide transport periplasmic protein LptA [Pseudomonadota bacterium]